MKNDERFSKNETMYFINDFLCLARLAIEKMENDFGNNAYHDSLKDDVSKIHEMLEERNFYTK